MSTNRFSGYSEKDLLTIIDALSNNSIQFTIPELKELQSELINKRIDTQKIGLISNIIMNQMDSGNKDSGRERRSRRAETKKMKAVSESAVKEDDNIEKTKKISVPVTDSKIESKPELTKKRDKKEINKPAIEKKAKEIPQDFEDDDYYEDDERFPVLNFLVVFYRVLGWLFVFLLIGGYAAYAYIMLMDNMPLLICGGGLALVVAGMILLFFSARAENILLKLETERQLRILNSK